MIALYNISREKQSPHKNARQCQTESNSANAAGRFCEEALFLFLGQFVQNIDTRVFYAPKHAPLRKLAEMGKPFLGRDTEKSPCFCRRDATTRREKLNNFSFVDILRPRLFFRARFRITLLYVSAAIPKFLPS